MWENFIGQQIRRSNRNLVIVNMLMLGAIAIYVAFNYRYLANFALGAADISRTELASLNDPAARFRCFVRVTGDKSFNTGVQSVEQTVDQYSNKVESTTVKAEYRVLMVGKRLLVVKTDPKASGETFTGAIEPMPDSVKAEIVAPAVREEPSLEGAFVPVILNANDYREEGWWSAVIIIPLLALVGWNLWKWQRRLSDYSHHPIYWRMTWFGPVDVVVQEIETNMRLNQVEKIGSTNICGQWLFETRFFGLTSFHLPDVVWLYKKVTKHSTNFIPTGKSFAVLLYDRHGYTSEFQIKEKDADRLIGRVLEQYPWIVGGYSDERMKLWKSQRATFLAVVDERRMEVLHPVN